MSQDSIHEPTTSHDETDTDEASTPATHDRKLVLVKRTLKSLQLRTHVKAGIGPVSEGP